MADALSLTASIVSAHISRNRVRSDELPELIQSVYAALTPTTQPVPETRQPAVPIRKSVFNDHVVCLECGKRFRTIKRHLEREHGISAAEYRARFGLADDYPMVAPEYAAARAAIAKRNGLGRQGGAKRQRGHR